MKLKPVGKVEEPLTPKWLLMKFLENWTAKDLLLAIRSNYTLNLKPLWSSIEDFIVEEILNWFKSERPDLYEILSSEEGRLWLKKNLRSIIST